jgi:hypothetical protein
MPGNPLHWGCTAPALTYLLVLGYFLLRPQRLTRTPVLPWAGTS